MIATFMSSMPVSPRRAFGLNIANCSPNQKRKNHLKANSSQNTKKKYKQQRYIIFGIDTTVCFVPKTDYMHMTKRNQLAAELTGQIDHWLIDGARIDRTKLARHDGFMLSVFNIISTMMFINLKIIIMNMKYTTINKLRLRKSTNCQKNSGFKAKVMRLNSFSSFFFNWTNARCTRFPYALENPLCIEGILNQHDKTF